MNGDSRDGPETPSERERWNAEQSWRQEKLALRERELSRSRWTNSPVVAVVGAAIAAALAGMFGFWTNYSNNQAVQAQETARAEAARILEVVKTGNPDTAAKNLQFLGDVGLISDPRVNRKLHEYVANRLPGQGISLPQSNSVAKAAATGNSEAADRAADSDDAQRRFLKILVSNIEHGTFDIGVLVGLIGSAINPANATFIDRKDVVLALRSLGDAPAAERCPAYGENRMTRRYVEQYATSTDAELAHLAKQALVGC